MRWEDCVVCAGFSSTRETGSSLPPSFGRHYDMMPSCKKPRLKVNATKNVHYNCYLYVNGESIILAAGNVVSQGGVRSPR